MTDRDVWGNADIYITMMHGQSVCSCLNRMARRSGVI